MSEYLIIPRINVKGANAQSAWWTITGPSPLAWMGLVRKIAIELGVEADHKIAIAIIHHDIEFRGDIDQYGNFQPWQLRAGALTTEKGGQSNDYVAGGMSMGLQPVALCNIICSLIIEGLSGINHRDFELKLQNSRLAGGYIENFNNPVWCDWDELLSKTPNGFFVKERSDLLDNIAPDQRVKVFVRHLYNLRTHADSEQRQWLMPVNLGYLPITPFTEKPSSRKKLHAYAEPLVGLVQFIHKRNITDKDLSQLFWSYQKIDTAYVVKQS